MSNIDKVIVSSDSALTAIYGTSASDIRRAIDRLIAADQARGITTCYFALDRASENGSVQFPPIPAGKAQQENDALYKNAIDTICQEIDPHYLVILGAPDIIPHIQLTNPVHDALSPNDDWDVYVPSDLPYACTAPYDVDPSKFIAPSRVVGRVPGLTGSGDSSFIIRALDTACNAVPAAVDAYRNYFAISAEVWAKSTTLSVGSVFGEASGLQTSPTQGPEWDGALLEKRSHFINCHGSSISPRFLGEDATQYSTAHWSEFLGSAMPGVVVAAECCYGAELYDPTGEQQNQIGIANAYLKQGAYGYFGSTNIAYGPANENAHADLLCQSFFRHLLDGSSLGLAALQARQDFVGGAQVLEPIGQKTLAQFVLLGDPSIHPVVSTHVDVATSVGGTTTDASHDVLHTARASRRRACMVRARELEACPVSESRPTASSSPTVLAELEKLADDAGQKGRKFRTFSVRFAGQAKEPANASPEKIHLLTFRGETKKTAPDDVAITRVPRTVALVAREVDGRIESVTHSLSK